MGTNTDEDKIKARARARAYYYANKARCLERSRAWRAVNKEKVKAYNAAYHSENRERENERSRNWKEENRKDMNARRRATYSENADKARAVARNRKKLMYARDPQKYRDLARQERKDPNVRARQAERGRLWGERNPDRRRAASRRWYQRNLEHARLQLAIAQATRRRRYVPWADVKAIKALYAGAALLRRETGRCYVVDHIVPLKGRLVSGLHVENNLRIIERFENARKSNKWDPMDLDDYKTKTEAVQQSTSEGVPLQGALF